MKRRTKIAFAVVGVAIGAIGSIVAAKLHADADATDAPCAEPADLPVPRDRVVRCAERYVKDQWYTSSLGRIGALDADPLAGGSWFALVSSRHGSLEPHVGALCTHPKDLQGVMGHLALFEPRAGKGASCRAFVITPMLGVSATDESCASIRARASCVSR
jgi:hypothetical protein